MDGKPQPKRFSLMDWIQHPFIQDFSANSAAKLINMAGGFISRIVVLRLLTKADVGLIATLTSLKLYFDMIALYGTQQISQKQMMEEGQLNRGFATYTQTRWLTTGLATGLFVLGAWVLGYHDRPDLLALIAINLILTAIGRVPEILFYASETFKPFAWLTILITVLSVSAQLTILWIGRDLLAYFWGLVAAALVYLVVMGLGARNYFPTLGPVLLPFKWTDIRALMKAATPLFLATFCFHLYFYIDTVMLEKLVGREAAADYNLAFVLLDQFLMLVWTQYILVFYPKMIRWFHGDLPKLWRYLKWTAVGYASLFLGLGILNASIGPWVIGFIFGSQYATSAWYVATLCPATFLLVLFLLGQHVLIIADRQRLYMMITAAGAVINFALNLILIPKNQIEGAILATTLTNLLTFITLIWVFWFYIKPELTSPTHGSAPIDND